LALTLKMSGKEFAAGMEFMTLNTPAAFLHHAETYKGRLAGEEGRKYLPAGALFF